MTINHQSKASMHVLNTPADPGVSQGARRATEETPGSAAPAKVPGADTEVVPRARQRKFSNADTIRQDALDTAFLTHPKRFKGRRPAPPTAVWINPPPTEKTDDTSTLSSTVNS